MEVARTITTASGPLARLVKPCLESLRRRWPGCPTAATVVTEGGDFPLPEGWDVTARRIMNLNHFSGGLVGVLDAAEGEVIYWTPVDVFLAADLPAGKMEALADYMARRGDVVRMSFARTPEVDAHHGHMDAVDGMEIVACSELRHCSLAAGLSLDCGLFSRRLLAAVLRDKPEWSPWAAEREGTERMLREFPRLRSLAVLGGLAERVGVHESNPGRWLNLEGLGPEDREAVLAAMPGATWQ